MMMTLLPTTALFLFIDPFTTPLEKGAAVGASVICVGLFIWAQLQYAQMKSDLKQHYEQDDLHFKTLGEKQTDILTQQSSTVETLRDIAASVSKLADAISQQTTNHREELSILREMATDQKVMMNTLKTSQDNLLSLLKQTIENR